MTPAPRPEPDIPARVRQVVAAAFDRKAQDLRVLHLGAVTDFTDYFVICSGTNARQVQAISEAVQERLREHRDARHAGDARDAGGAGEPGDPGEPAELAAPPAPSAPPDTAPPRGVRPLAVEGQNLGQWILLDYGDFLVHVFDEERRRFYALDKLWSDAPDVTAELAEPAALGG